VPVTQAMKVADALAAHECVDISRHEFLNISSKETMAILVPISVCEEV
jgi:hypothetical protein